MKSLVLKNATAVLPDDIAENVSILIEDGKIVEISEKELLADKILNLEGAKIFAGFIDIHNHGAVGFDVNASSKNGFIKIGEFLAKHGVTAWLPTFVPDADIIYRKVIQEINETIEEQADLPIAQIVGVHYEGVFANEIMCGALRPEFFKTYTNDNEISQLPMLENGIHLTTLAPEIENGIHLIKKFIAQNWIVSIGHTRADTKTLESAKQAGAKHLTHFFNAMTGIHHRDTGVAGWGLISDDITFDIIADGVHVAPEMLKFAVETKGCEKVSLISDSVAPTGLSDGNFNLWGENIFVKNGKTRNKRGSIAGSVITMFDAVKNMMNLGFTETQVSKMASANPAKLLGINKTYGTIEVGKRADLVAIDESEHINLTIVGGRICQNRLPQTGG